MTAYRLDRSVRLVDGGRVVIGGSPLRILTLAPNGADVVRAISEGGTVRSASGVPALLLRLQRAGIVHPVPSGGDYPGQVTFVIPTVGRDVSKLVSALPAEAEVIVVDDNARSGPAAARNQGWRDASGDVVVFLDDDCVPTEGWLEELLAHFVDYSVVAVAPRVIAPSSSTALGRYEEFRSPLDLGERPAPVVAGSRVSYVPSAALAVRRNALVELDGFDESLRFGEDVDLVWRLERAGGMVRYEPAAVVEHPARRTLGAFVMQRFGYGTSAAPLARRHPGALAPLRISPWSALAWALVAAGRVRLGLGVAAVTTALLPRKLTMLRNPWPEALRLAGLGHLFAARQIADALIRAWWPLALLAALLSRRARAVVLTAAVFPHLVEWAQRRPRLDPIRWTALRILDDAAYGAGVWAGCVRERTIDPLVPRNPSFLPLRSGDPVPEDDRRREQHTPDRDRPDDDSHE